MKNKAFVAYDMDKKIKVGKENVYEYEIRQWVHCLAEAKRIQNDPDKLKAAKAMAKKMLEDKQEETAALKSVAR